MKKVYGFGINDSETPVQLRDLEGNVIWRCPFLLKVGKYAEEMPSNNISFRKTELQ